MINFPIPRLDKDEYLIELLRPYCRLDAGEVWIDEKGEHIVACENIDNRESIINCFGGRKSTLAIHDPPYNMIAFAQRRAGEFTDWAKRWIDMTETMQSENASIYIWLGADQKNNFEPLPEFVIMMKESGYKSRSFITMRNQRGYGTQKNWMAVRQELLYYTKGEPVFNAESVYTDIPKVVKGYYKQIGGKITENLERSHSQNIRAGNVWIDIQQVFHLMEENVNGCFAQKPLKALRRIIDVSSNRGDWILDFFAHSGSTLLAAEIKGRKCFTLDVEPVYCEITIRRLENFRNNGKTGWQNSNPFAEEIRNDNKIKAYLEEKYMHKI